VDSFPHAPASVQIDRLIKKRLNVTPTYEDLGRGALGLTRFGKDGMQEVVVSKTLDEEMARLWLKPQTGLLQRSRLDLLRGGKQATRIRPEPLQFL
jgi:hypothetical protein